MSESNSSTQITKIYFDIPIGNEPAGRMIISLFTSAAPRACENFRALCTGENNKGENGQPLHYKGSAFYRVIPGLICEGGVITKGTDIGIGGESSYGPDTFIVNHSFPGMVSVVNTNPMSNGSNFFICMSEGSPCKNGERCLGFAQVIDGLHVLMAIQSVGSVNGKTEKVVIIKDCGLLLNDAKHMPSISSSGSYGCWSIDDFVSDAAGSHSSNAPKYPTRSFLHKRMREEYENEQLFIIDEHLKEIGNIKVELMKLLEKETGLKKLLRAAQRVNCSHEKDFEKQLLETQTKITYLRKKIFIINVIPSLSDEDVLKVESVIKEYGTDTSDGSDSD